MSENTKKIRSIDDIQMDIDATKRVIEYLMDCADGFYKEKDEALIAYKEELVKKEKKVVYSWLSYQPKKIQRSKKK